MLPPEEHLVECQEECPEEQEASQVASQEDSQVPEVQVRDPTQL